MHKPIKRILWLLLGASFALFYPIWFSSCSKSEGRRHAADDHINHSLSLIYDGYYEEAIQECDIAIKLFPSEPKYLFVMAQCEQYAENYDLAAKYTERALRLAGTDDERVYAYSNLGYYYFKADQPEKALDAYKQALHLGPQSYSAARGASLSLAQLGHLEEAYKYMTMLENSPSETVKHNYWGQIYGSAKQFDKAAAEYSEILKSEPDSSDALIGLGKAQEGLKKYDIAENTYLKLLEIDPENCVAYIRLGSLYITLSQYKKAENELTKALSLSEDSVNSSEIYFLRAKVLRALRESSGNRLPKGTA